MTTNVSRRPGLYEAQLAAHSGMRNFTGIQHLVSAQTQNVNARPIGGTASAAVTSWTALATNNNPVPFCATLVALVAQASATTGTVQLRVRGFDQFGEYCEEITPVISFVAKTNNYIYLAKVFSYVTSVEFKSTGLDIAGDTLSLGTRWDWTRTVDATNNHINGRNLGIALYARSGRRPAGDSIVGQRMPLPVGAGMGAVWMRASTNQLYGDISNEARPELYGHATNLLQITAPPSNGDTVTIDGKVYTWKSAPTSADGDVLIGAAAADCGFNLTCAVNLSGGAGTLYGSNTTRHPSVRAGKYPATAVVEFYALEAGAIGNAIAVAESGANTTWVFTSFFRNGYDYPIEVVSLVVRETNGAVVALDPTKFLVGYSEDGWAGAIEKAHILEAASVSAWAVADNMFITQVMHSAEVAV